MVVLNNGSSRKRPIFSNGFKKAENNIRTFLTVIEHAWNLCCHSDRITEDETDYNLVIIDQLTETLFSIFDPSRL